MMHGYRLFVALMIAVLLTPFPALGAQHSGPRAASASVPVGDKVNVNTADVKDLMTLSGVGRKVAEKIVEYRQAHGPFKKPEELRKVEGIGAALWERNRDRIIIK
ncbi:MAG TPA: helix-hairpin-helix domain-containing protein [Methylomirabilota bacterium]|jgi:competence protein ComEA|nr:helix-hairpin-helix domain-containing protein [Methylomirabilota bacterium]